MKKGTVKKALFSIIISVIIVPIILTFVISGFSPPQTLFNMNTNCPNSNDLLLFHGSILDTTGCASCHTQPLTGDCIACHPSPSTVINNEVDFPHHDYTPGGPLDDCSDVSCHDSATDIRFVVILIANHDYCFQCHDDNQCGKCHIQGPPNLDLEE